jgi:predicted DNA-binding transcriptional regulator AlpA
MELVEDLAHPLVPVVQVCTALGLSRATVYRVTCPDSPPMVRHRIPSPRQLGDDERQAVVDVMHSAEFADIGDSGLSLASS